MRWVNKRSSTSFPCVHLTAIFGTVPSIPSKKHAANQVWFMARDPEGLILYNGQQTNGNGDFLALTLEQGHPVLRYVG